MKKLIALAVCSIALTTGCTTMIASDYPAYLANNQGQVTILKLNKVAAYSISPATQQHKYSARSFMAGAANSWVIEIGKMLDATLQSPDYAGHFNASANQGLQVDFDLGNYEFKNFQTYLTLNVKVKQSGQEVLSKAYTIVGKNQAGKVVMGGGFAMKNAVQQSTKAAIDDILKQLMDELKAKNIAVAGFSPRLS